jgi:hypothetical protein
MERDFGQLRRAPTMQIGAELPDSSWKLCCAEVRASVSTLVLITWMSCSGRWIHSHQPMA